MNAITIQKNLFDQAISSLQSAINKKNTIDITSNISLETLEGRLILKATDHEIFIRTTLEPTSINGELKCAINGELISNVMKTLHDTEIIIEQGEEFLFIKQNKNSIFKIPIFEISEFPFTQDYKTMEKVEFDNHFLLQSIKKVMHCCNDKDNFNIALQGISLEIKDQQVNIVGTDTKRLGYIQKDYSHAIESFSCIIHKKTISEILKLFNNNFEFYIKRIPQDDKLEIISFVNQEIELYTKLINANFPEYINIIKSKPQNTIITINKDKILKGINQINSICTRLKMTFSTNKVILETLEGINGSSASITVENVENTLSEPITVGFVNKHIIECLSNTQYQEVELHIGEPEKPIFIIAKDFKEIIMPQTL